MVYTRSMQNGFREYRRGPGKGEDVERAEVVVASIGSELSSLHVKAEVEDAGYTTAHAAVLDHVARKDENPTALEEAAEMGMADLVRQELTDIGAHIIIVNLEETGLTTTDMDISGIARKSRMDSAAGIVVSALSEHGWRVDLNGPLGVPLRSFRDDKATLAELGIRREPSGTTLDPLKRFIVFFKDGSTSAEPNAPSA